MISRVIKVSVRVISLGLRFWLITLISTLIILDITKTSFNNCLKFLKRTVSAYNLEELPTWINLYFHAVFSIAPHPSPVVSYETFVRRVAWWDGRKTGKVVCILMFPSSAIFCITVIIFCHKRQLARKKRTSTVMRGVQHGKAYRNKPLYFLPRFFRPCIPTR